MKIALRIILIVVALGIILFIIFMPNALITELRSPVSEVIHSQRVMAEALEKYYADHGCYPAFAFGDKGINSAALREASLWRDMPTFRIQRAGEFFASLTTPLAYIEKYPPDLLAPTKETSFGYYTDGVGWILLSVGPDKDYDIDPVEDYDGSIPQPSDHLLIHLYDPTNGIISNGDRVRVRQ
jgi:hypothetical protein